MDRFAPVDTFEHDRGDSPGLRERKKRETRGSLVDAAIDLSTRHGFEATTVEDIADAVGVSARTFHRYFARKEDAIIGESPTRLVRFRENLSASSHGSVLDGVRAAALLNADEITASSAREKARARLIAATPALRAHNLSLYDEWAGVISDYAATAVGEAPTDRWPATLGAATMAALSSATRRWAASDDLDLRSEYDGVLDLLRGLDRLRPTKEARR